MSGQGWEPPSPDGWPAEPQSPSWPTEPPTAPPPPVSPYEPASIPPSPRAVPPPPPGGGWATPAPPRKKRKKRWPWVLAALVVLPTLLIGGCVVLFVGFVRGPIDAANEFLADVDAGDATAALVHVDPRCLSDADARALVASLGAGLQSYRLTGTSNENNSSGEARGTITFTSGTEDIVFTMSKPGDDWLVCGVQLSR